MSLVPVDAGRLDEGAVWYYRHSMVWLSRLRFQLIPGNAAGHEGTAEPNHDAANLRLWRSRSMETVVMWRVQLFLFSKITTSAGHLT